MEVKLQSGEQIVDLERNGYKIIQNRERFCFGMDAVLLTGFAKVGKGERALDLGTGTGIIPILLEAKTEGQDFEALEIQPESAEMARRSVMLNNLQERIKIVDGDIKEASKIFGAASFNVVTTNPPYMTENHGVKNPDEPKAIARHEIKCNLEDVIRESAKLLKPKGRFSIGVAHKYNFPAISTSILQNAKIHIFCVFPLYTLQVLHILLAVVPQPSLTFRLLPLLLEACLHLCPQKDVSF